MLRYRVEPTEFLYPVDSGGRFDRDTGVPPIALVSLPHLTTDTDAVFDEISAFVGTLPRQTMHCHYQALFAWLCDRFERDMIVERSGGSLSFMRNLLEVFPDARFIHLYRDGRRVATSMSRHNIYILWLLAQDVRRLVDPVATPEQISTRLLSAAPATASPPFLSRPEERLDALASAMGLSGPRAMIPAGRFGVLWSAMVQMGLAVLESVPGDRLISMDFDELLLKPEQELPRMLRHISRMWSDEDEEWLVLAREHLRSDERDWREGLDPKECRKLEIACRSAMEMLKESLGERHRHDGGAANVEVRTSGDPDHADDVGRA